MLRSVCSALFRETLLRGKFRGRSTAVVEAEVEAQSLVITISELVILAFFVINIVTIQFADKTDKLISVKTLQIACDFPIKLFITR